MEKELLKVAVNIEIVPIYTILGKKEIIKLSDFLYGEWLIYKAGLPIYHINIFDEYFVDLKNHLDSSKKGIEYYIAEFNRLNYETLSLTQGFWFWGFTNYNAVEYTTVEIFKFPFVISH